MARLDTAISAPRSALQSGSYRLYLGGSLLHHTGEWMDMVALNWVILQGTQSPLHLALLNACRLVPAFLLSIPAGVLADRFDRRRLLIGLHAGMAGCTLVLAYVLASGLPFAVVALVVVVRSILAALDLPIRSAFIPQLVPAANLTSAIALHTAVLNICRMIGPAVAGFLLSHTDAADLILAHGLGTMAVCLSLVSIPHRARAIAPRAAGGNGAMAEALQFIRRDPMVRTLLTLAVVPMLFGFPYTAMLPVFAQDLLHAGPAGFGLLLSVSALGALGGSLWLSRGREPREPGKWLIGSTLGFGVALLLFVMSTNLAVAMVTIFLVGMTGQLYRTMSRVTLHQHVPDHLRGRIVSMALMDRGFIPLGSLLASMATGWWGAFGAGMMMGSGCIVVTLLLMSLHRGLWIREERGGERNEPGRMDFTAKERHG